MNIDSQLLKSMLGGAAKNDVRFFLNGVHVFGETIEATNGHYLFTAKIDKTEEDRIFKIIGTIPAKAQDTEISFETNIATHKNFNNEIVGVGYVEVIDGKFPDTQKVIDKFKPEKVSEIAFSPEYLSLPKKLFGANGVTLEFGGKDGTARAKFKHNKTSYTDIEMYLMPMRMD